VAPVPLTAMRERNQYFSRVTGRVDLDVNQRAYVAIVGVGSVGSMMALELARSGIGHLLLIDGDRLEAHNLARHALPSGYLATNKAEATAQHLKANVPGLDVGAVPHHLDERFSDEQLDRLITPADLVVIATDRRSAQRRIAARALAMDIPAVIPGLYADRGGEVFVQLNPGQACFRCWDDFRDPDAELRSVASINADALAVIQQTAYLAIALLDPRSRHARDLAPTPNDPRPRQLFVMRPGAALLRTPATRRPGCPGCAVGPSPLSADERGATNAGDEGALHGALHARAPAAGWHFMLSENPTPPVLEHVAVSQPILVEGETLTLSWRAANATHVLIDGHEPQPAEGELALVMRESMAFTLTAVNPHGQATATSGLVRVIAPVQIHELRLVAFPTARPAAPPMCPRPIARSPRRHSSPERPASGSWSGLAWQMRSRRAQ
jgi:molybdopterin/thiamine biosynthesis adenylyltransferase